MATKYTYASPGVINVTDAAGNITELKFTSTGQIQAIKDPLSRVTNFTYDNKGNLNQITAPGNTTYSFTYDNKGRLLSQTDPLNQKVSFTYDANRDLLLSVTDQKGQVMRYNYDGSGNLSGITYANDVSETFTYDINGRLIQTSDRSGDIFRYSYDANGRLARKTFDDNTFEAYTYDNNGNLTSVQDVRGGTTILVYDTQNRLTKITYGDGRFLEYTYDTQGRRTQMRDGNGFAVNYSYDNLGLLTELTNGSGAAIITYNYDADGRLTRETNGNGTYTTYSYDTTGQLTEISHRKADGTVNSFFRYSYDNLGRQTKTETGDGVWNYTYDATGQLTRAQFASTNASIPNQDLQYVYDAAGNRTNAILNGVTTNYKANNLNQYTTVDTAQHFYDADGNLIRVVDGSRTWIYGYNDENRLIRAETPDGTFEYEYNAFGDRTAVIQNGVRTEYLVDPFGLGNVVGEYSNGVATNYVHGLGLVGRFNGSDATYYDADLIGSTVGLTNGTGNYVNRYAYRPFGENLITTEGVGNPFEYVGQWGVMDEASGLDFMRARYYLPSAGRFLNPDPVGQGGGLNLYAYTNNNPINLIDPLGLWYYNIGVSVAYNWLGFNAGYMISNTGIYPYYGPTATVGGTVGVSATYSPTNVQTGWGNPSLGLGYGRGNINIDKEKNWEIGVGAGIGSPISVSQSKILPPWRPWNHLSPFLPYVKRAASSAADAARDAWRWAQNLISPLVLDLDADGIELISLQNSQAFFDLDSDRFAEQTGWVKPDDGLLALDKNNNAQIDNIGELFGNATTDGFIILKELDSNKDNIIDSRDTQFTNLRIWKDADSDGFTDAGELQTLTAWGINSINLNYQTTNLTNEGNRISSTSTYTLANGTTQQIVDVWFSLSQLNTIYTGDFQLKAETLFLPSLRGYGKLPDLYIAMSQDVTLLGTMRNLVQLSTQNYEQFHGQFLTQVDALLFRWAGVDYINPNTPRGYFNSRKLGFLEKFTGEAFNQRQWGANPGPQASNVLKTTWDNLYRQLVGRLLVQGAMRDFFPQTSFNHDRDRLQTDTNLTTIINTLVANTPTSLDQAGMYWTLAIAALDAFEERFGLTQDVFDTQISQALTTVGLTGFLKDLRQPEYFQVFSDVIFGSTSNDTLTGGIGNDLINGGAGDDVISGGAGNDILEGASGNDTVNGDDGDDIIKAGLGNDILDGGSGQDTLKLDLSAFTTNLVIENPLNSTTLPGVASLKNFEQIHLTTGSGSDRIIQGSIINGTVFRSSDIFNGGVGDDFIDAGLGLNDRVDGGAGNDTLVVNYSVDDVGGRILSFLGEATTNGVSGAITRNTGNASDWLDSIGFVGIENFHITGTRLDDEIFTWNGNDIINAGAGNDEISPGIGINTVNGGDGGDRITLIPGGDSNVDGGAGLDSVIIDLSSQTTGFNLTFNGGIFAGIGSINNIEYIVVQGSNGNDVVNLDRAIGYGLYNEGVRVEGKAGNDNVTGGSGADWLFGEVGNDTLNGGEGRDRLEGGDGDDILNGGAGNDNALALVVGGTQRAGLFGGAGNDTLDSGDGNDYLDPGSGIDIIIGGAGHDEMVLNFSTATTPITISYADINDGRASNGTTFRGIEQIYLATGSGNDTVNLSATIGGLYNYGNDVRLGTGNDSVIGGSGADALYGDGGDDTLDGGTGRDYLEGGDGDDILRGGAGDDNGFALAIGAKRCGLFGGAGNDSLFGGDGNDLLHGGAGDDLLQGDAGVDGFLFDGNAAFTTDLIGRDTIVDFVTGIDKILLDKTTFTTLTSPTNGSLTASEFAVIDESVNGATVAGASIARIVFNRSNGDLFYNPDGAIAGLGSGGYFAKLSGVSSLSATDFALQA